MSQTLFPINGGESSVTTTLNVPRDQVLSPQAIRLRKLEPQPTEWVVEGKPIYRRLPSASENYQIDFFEDKSKAWVYIPYGEGLFGPRSLQVVASDDNKFIVIKSGSIVCSFGQISVDPVVIDCKLVGLQSTRYAIGYQLYYDDAPFEAQYSVEDFSLQGYDLEISSSTDTVVGWRYPAVNAFLSDDSFWKNRDDYFPSYSQPLETFISWKSEKYSAYSKITVRCPPGTVYEGKATLSYKINGSWIDTQEALISVDSQSQYYEFNLDGPTFQEEWKVSWEDEDMAIANLTISGIITLTRKPATSTTTFSLAAYPENSIPPTTRNLEGEEVPLVLCILAYVDVDDTSEIIRIDDVRDVVYREFKPVAEWLTRPEDEDLIDLYEQVKDYPTLWMAPPSAMKQEYLKLTDDLILLSDSVIHGK